MAPARRELGYTEGNWCLAIEGGTGVTVSAFLFDLSLSKPTVQAAVNKLLSAKPFLSSQIVSENQKLFFEIGEKTVPVEEVAVPIPAETGEDDDDDEDDDEETAEAESWLKIVDSEMNTMFPSTKPTPIFQVHLYKDLPETLVVLRAHSGAADMVSSGPIGSEFLNCLKEVVQEERSGGENIEELLQKVTLETKDFQFYKGIENSIPPGGAKKPFWAHGTDVIGYGLVSRRHAYLPFRDTERERQSRLIRASLSKEATERLLKACKDNNTNLYGALTAAGLKSVVTFKNAGDRGEHYGVAVMYNCRPVLDPKLPEDALGWYHSALLKTTHTAENHQFWQVAASASKSFEDSIKNRKHFTDMGNLNMLMVQAIHHPNLTPSSTMRTAMYSLLYDPVIESTPVEAAEVLHLKDYVSSSSTKGVGPCIAIFHFIRDGALHISFVYPSPLFLRQDVQTIVDSILGYITV